MILDAVAAAAASALSLSLPLPLSHSLILGSAGRVSLALLYALTLSRTDRHFICRTQPFDIMASFGVSEQERFNCQ